MAKINRRADALQLYLGAARLGALRTIGTLPGVVITHAHAKNAPGRGRLLSSGANGRQLSWQAPGSSVPGPPAVVTADGEYLLEDGTDPDNCLRIQAYIDYLLGPGLNQPVYLADRHQNTICHNDISAAEASSGDVDTWTMDLKAAGPTDLLNVRAWLDAACPDMEIGKDGIAWYAPDAEDHADVLIWDRIASGATETLHCRRTIGAGAGYDPAVLNHFRFGWTGL